MFTTDNTSGFERADLAMPSIKDAISQGEAKLSLIHEMVAELAASAGKNRTQEDEERAIHEAALSVKVRSDWYTPNQGSDRAPAEYYIVLCTGKPACRIHGRLSEHSAPQTAVMQVQDRGTPWVGLEANPRQIDDMLAYARCFYFGER